MTISGDTVCGVIQAFPVLLILAQNANRCLKTPLVYHPPHPTRSPEYYEALDALFQSLYGHGHEHGHGHDDHSHGCDDHNHSYQYDYGYGKKSTQKYYYNQKPCHQKPTKPHYGHGQSSPGYGHNSHGYGHNSHGYGHNTHTYGYPTYVVKVNKNPGHSGHSHDGSKVYAPNQVHNIKHKYKVVVKANKVRRKSAAIKIQGFFPPRENRGFRQSLRERLQGKLHLQPQTPYTNPAYIYPFGNRPTDEYGRPIYQYGTPNYEQRRPNHEYYRPGISNTNMIPNQNQFSVPNRYNFPEQNGFQNTPTQNGFEYQPSQNGFQTAPNQVNFPNAPSQNEFPNNNGNSFENPETPRQDGLEEILGQVGFPSSPTPNEFPNTSGNGFDVAPNTDSSPSGSKEAKQNEDTLIVIPNDTEKNENPFTNPNASNEDKPNEGTLIVIPGNTGGNENPFANSNAPKENKENEDTLIVIPGNTGIKEDGIVFGGPTNVAFPTEEPAPAETSKVTESPKTDPTTATATPDYPPLTPVSTDSRNNFNFGPSGIFQETCTTVDNEVGSCLQVTECPPYLKMIQESRSNPNALQLLRRAHCGFQGTNPKVCCPRPGIPTAPPTPPPSEQPIVMPEEPVEPEPSEEPKTNPQPGSVALPDPPFCGTSNASFTRVVGGMDAKLGDFPWMALLGYKERRAGAGARWLCGGSLISSRHVLTAAHCIHTRENDLYLVRLGELDIARDDEGATPVDILIKTLVKHEEYSPKSFTNDIGILVLERNVQYTDLIKPICVPRTSELRARSFENYQPLIAGWGDTEFRGPSATHLQVLQLPVVSNTYCAQAYSAYKAQVIDQRVLCAGFKQGVKDACQGDSGGPLMQPVQNTETRKTYLYQIGVVSYGRKCAEPGFPGVYTRVTDFVPWIEETVAKH